jgi:uncharacterized membrane protein YfcA
MFDLLPYFILTGLGVGFMGAFLGVGGGVIVVPILAVIFHIPIHTAIGTSLAIVVANSMAASSRYLSGGYANLNLALALGFFSALGAIGGSNISLFLPAGYIFISLGAAQLITAGFMLKGDRLKERFKVRTVVRRGALLNGSYYELSTGEQLTYTPQRLPFLMTVAVMSGLLSGLVGIGGAIFIIPAMNLIAGVPIKAAIPTSGFMMGFTAVSGAMVFYLNGHIDPLVFSSVVPSTFLSSLITVRLFKNASSAKVYNGFILFIILLALFMIYRGIKEFL